MNDGVKPYHDQFDVVHCRNMAHGIMDFQSFLVEAASCLKPGGILLVFGADGPGQVNFDEHKEPITEMTPLNRLLRAAEIAADVSATHSPRGRGTLHFDWI